MASRETLEKNARSLFKRGLTTEKQHKRHMNQIAAMFPAAAPASQGGAGPDAAMNTAVQPANAPELPATVSVPGGTSSNAATVSQPAM